MTPELLPGGARCTHVSRTRWTACRTPRAATAIRDGNGKPIRAAEPAKLDPRNLATPQCARLVTQTALLLRATGEAMEAEADRIWTCVKSLELMLKAPGQNSSA